MPDTQCLIYSGDLYLENPNSLLVFVGTVFRSALLYKIDLQIKQALPSKHLIGHTGVIFSAKIFTAHDLLATISDDRTIRLWSLEGEEKKVLYGHRARIWSVVVADQILVTSGEDATVRWWDLTDDCKCLAVTEGHRGKHIRCLAVDKDGRVVSGGDDGAVKIYNDRKIETV